MLTLIKKDKEKFTYSQITLDSVVDTIRKETLAPLIDAFHVYYPVIQGRSSNANEEEQSNLPRVCFSAQLRKDRYKAFVKEYNPLILLEVNNLPSPEEAIELKKRASLIPFTRLCFIGASGRSLKIVSALHITENTAEMTLDDYKKCHFNAFRMLHYHYSSQLGLCIDYLEPTLERSCLISADKNLYYNPDSEEYYVGLKTTDVPEYRQAEKPQSRSILPGYSKFETMNEIFEWCLRDAMSDARSKVGSDDELKEATLSLLAEYCNDSNLPVDFAIRRVGWKGMFRTLPPNYIETVFNNAYAEKESLGIPFGHIEKSALLTYKTEAFLNLHYELRRNVMTGVVQYRPRDGFTFDFQDMDEGVMNSMTNRALKAGLGSWDKDMRRIVNSDDIRRYEPLADYLNDLPHWDGRDHIKQLIDRLPIDNERIKYFFHIWLLSMIAHWLGKDNSHGNAIVPLLIGGQGCGKTSFASIILPPELRAYYNDKVNFKNETDLSLGLTSFALINIDEFDSLKRSQQPTLKYLVSKNEVKLRPPYGKAFVSRPRFASFIATTNNLRPLVDTTGSRRFICIRIPEDKYIDFTTPIDYSQLYAQIVHEVMHGARYWLDTEETAEVMKHNMSFQRVTDLSLMINMLFKVPETDNNIEELTISEIVDLLCKTFPDLNRTTSLNVEVGRLMKRKGFPRHKRTSNICYQVVML